jgi:hypothetical protein
VAHAFPEELFIHLLLSYFTTLSQLQRLYSIELDWLVVMSDEKFRYKEEAMTYLKIFSSAFLYMRRKTTTNFI